MVTDGIGLIVDQRSEMAMYNVVGKMSIINARFSLRLHNEKIQIVESSFNSKFENNYLVKTRLEMRAKRIGLMCLLLTMHNDSTLTRIISIKL